MDFLNKIRDSRPAVPIEFPYEDYIQAIVDETRKKLCNDMGFTLEEDDLFPHWWGARNIRCSVEDSLDFEHGIPCMGEEDRNDFVAYGISWFDFEYHQRSLPDKLVDLMFVNVYVGEKAGFSNPKFIKRRYRVHWQPRDDVDTKPAFRSV